MPKLQNPSVSDIYQSGWSFQVEVSRYGDAAPNATIGYIPPTTQPDVQAGFIRAAGPTHRIPALSLDEVRTLRDLLTEVLDDAKIQ